MGSTNQPNWSRQFCDVFDSIFGEKHFSLTCFFRSLIASLLSVSVLYFIFGSELGLLEARSGHKISLSQVLLFGVILNIIPDYISLFQTRWILSKLKIIYATSHQAAILLADFVITGIIAYSFIKFVFYVIGFPNIGLGDMIFLYSPYAIFFWSTFITSIWAWIYCASAWTLRILSSGLSEWLPVEKRPGQVLALIASLIVFVLSVITYPISHSENAWPDRIACSIFTNTCPKAIKIHKETENAFRVVQAKCGQEPETSCVLRTFREMELSSRDIASMISTACKALQGPSCRVFGIAILDAKLSNSELQQVYSVLNTSCNDGNLQACNVHAAILGTKAAAGSDLKATKMYAETCEKGYVQSCANLGTAFLHGNGIDKDEYRAWELLSMTCDAGIAQGCHNKATMLLNVDHPSELNFYSAIKLFIEYCEKGFGPSCLNIARLSEFGEYFPLDEDFAYSVYEKLCAVSYGPACYYKGKFENRKKLYDKSSSSYLKACELGTSEACNIIKNN